MCIVGGLRLTKGQDNSKPLALATWGGGGGGGEGLGGMLASGDIE